MHRVRLTDDGRAVRLDLHSASIAEGERLIRRAAAMAHRRGRTSLVVVHGSSTSERLYRNPTLKHRLYDLLDEDALPGVASAWRRDGETVLGLSSPHPHDSRPIRLSDL